ncbi:restriction endonuclease subunit S [Rothia sp. CCM 9417]|uniref:restriction endonuclease subunit S n=1 Tax=Rothia sp. CCM 9417 TaxID=3402657 RepID=UPI003AE28C2A
MNARLVKLKYLADFNPPVPANVRSSNDKFPIYPMDKIESFGKLSSSVESRPISELLNGYSYLEPTDVAYAKVTPCFENGKGILGRDLPGPSFATTELTVLRPKPGVDQRYLAYLLQTPDFMNPAISSMTGAGGLKRVSEEYVKNLKFPLPSLDEQKRIADELDRELTEIDELISDQQCLLNLTTEKFNAELRSLTYPEGIETVPLKRFADITLGKMITPSDKGGMEVAPYIRAANIQPGGVFIYQSDQKKMWFSSDELSYLDLKKGDVLVVEGGAGFGRSAVLEEDLPGWGFQNSINRVRVNNDLADAHFIDFCIRAQLLSGELENLTNQSTIPHLTAEKLNLIQIPNIEVGQQTEFANELFNLNHRNSILIAEMKNLISILLELKQSKIISLLN